MAIEMEARRTADLLIVESHEHIDLLRHFMELSLPGRTILDATDTHGALKLAIRHRPRLVLVDHELPDANGIALTARIRSELPDTMVIVLTGLDMVATEANAHAFAAGAFACVHKDTITTGLLPLVMRVLDAGGADSAAGDIR